MDPPVVAVLPFADLDPGGGRAYVTAGFGDDIVAMLSRFRTLVVLARSTTAGYAEMLLFSSGGSGARRRGDGMNATAFPSGVMGMSIEALEQTGPVVFWRKELREGSGGPGKYRGGLGQVIEIGAADGHHFHFNAMFDRVDHPARGRAGGCAGAPGGVRLDDGTPLRAKGRQYVPPERRLVLELPGGAVSATPRPATMC